MRQFSEALREGGHELIVEFSAKFRQSSVQTGTSRTCTIPKWLEEIHHSNIELSVGSRQLVNTGAIFKARRKFLNPGVNFDNSDSKRKETKAVLR